MKTRNVFRIMMVISMIITTLAVTSPAFAAKPVQTVTEVDVYHPYPDATCSFTITAHEYGQIRIIQWLDDNGQPVRETDIYGNMKQDWSANGKTVNVQYQGPIQLKAQYFTDKNVITEKAVGTNVMVTVPGYGKIFGGGGQIASTYVFSPDWQTVISYSIDKDAGNINYDWGPICDYLGPE